RRGGWCSGIDAGEGRRARRREGRKQGRAVSWSWPLPSSGASMVLPPRKLGKSHDSRGLLSHNRALLNPKFTATCHRGEDRSVARLSLQEQTHDSGPSNRASIFAGERDGSGSTLASEQRRKLERQRDPCAPPGERREPAA